MDVDIEIVAGGVFVQRLSELEGGDFPGDPRYWGRCSRAARRPPESAPAPANSVSPGASYVLCDESAGGRFDR
jgi:hypothetical protein